MPDASTLMPSARYIVLVALFCAAAVAMLFCVNSTEVVVRSPVMVASIPDVLAITAFSNSVVPEVPTLSATCTLEMPAALDRVETPPASILRVLAADAPLNDAEMLLLSKEISAALPPPETSRSISDVATIEKAVKVLTSDVAFCTDAFNCVDCSIKPAFEAAVVSP